MAGVYVPEKKNHNSAIFGLAGAALGAKFGGMQGAVAGSQLGEKFGEAATGPNQAVGAVGGNSSAIERRLANLDAQRQGAAQLQQAQVAIAQLPPEQQQLYGPPIQEALLKARDRGFA